MNIVHETQKLLMQALDTGTSDIHIESLAQSTRIRLRKDATLQLGELINREQGLALIARIKLLAGMNVSENRLPQDGALRIETPQGPADFRVNSLPGFWGEGLALRVMGTRRSLRKLDELGLTPEQLTTLQKLLARREGLILATGPTGSGKTTLLYACLRALSTPAYKLMSVEDPVEVALPGVVQLPVTPQLSYPDALKALLRQSPDTILIGEIRDPQSAHIAIQAALTGHQILSSLHAASPQNAPQRLQDLGISASFVASTLLATIGTRLVAHAHGRTGSFELVVS